MKFAVLIPLPALLAGVIAAAADPAVRHDSEAGRLVNEWHAAGTAAGNTGDLYDNRDGGHSPLRLDLFPQVRRVTYTDAEKQQRRDWALATGIRPGVVVGNSSTAAEPRQGGSNPRAAYSQPGGLAALHAQYRANNLYVYPEHRDHDPGPDGDLFPANSPYLLISQGSSVSDQPFLEAVFLTLAAFPPETKKRLIADGSLMPAVQMILRASQRQLAGPDDYLTGLAHPTVFDATNLNLTAMVRRAQGLRPDALPPMAQVRVVSDEQQAPGRDYFDPYQGERLHETPGAVAWLWRGLGATRRVVVSADSSYDPNGGKLRFHWSVLRGDASGVTIKPMNDRGSVVEIRVPWPARPAVPGSPGLPSGRVDVGCFVHNGHHWSAPAFLTWFTFAQEGRAYAEDGRLLEVGYGVGHGTLTVPDWSALLAFLARETREPRGRFLRAQLGDEAWDALLATHSGHTEAAAQEAQLAAEHLKTEAEQMRLAAASRETQARAGATDAEKHAAAAAAEAARVRNAEVITRLNNARARTAQALEPARSRLMPLLEGWRDDPEFCVRHADELRRLARAADEPARERFQLARRKMVNFGLAEEGDALRLTPLQPGRFSDFERSLLAQLNLAALVNFVLPGVLSARWDVLYTDPRLSLPKDWRDVYRHAPDGTVLGWRRLDNGQATEFMPGGYLVTARDARGRPLAARATDYFREQGKVGPEVMWARLLYRPMGPERAVRHTSDADLVGTVEPAP
ncbi:MAG: hypothetical protein ACKVYV_09800 [Limisphaerales bacterium]